jgi:NTP pyrophosphatase (non-canonical NTP hydrolase)
MNLIEYKQRAMRTAPAVAEDDLQTLIVAAMGLCGEAGELAGHLAEVSYSAVPSRETSRVIEELGDVMWYAALAASVLRMELSGQPLPHRGPTGFPLVLCGLTGAFSEHIKKAAFHDHPLDKDLLRTNLRLIVGWIERMSLACYDVTLSEICRYNIDKLEARYPAGFNSHDSMNRAV